MKPVAWIFKKLNQADLDDLEKDLIRIFHSEYWRIFTKSLKRAFTVTIVSVVFILILPIVLFLISGQYIHLTDLVSFVTWIIVLSVFLALLKTFVYYRRGIKNKTLHIMTEEVESLDLTYLRLQRLNIKYDNSYIDERSFLEKSITHCLKHLAQSLDNYGYSSGINHESRCNIRCGLILPTSINGGNVFMPLWVYNPDVPNYEPRQKILQQKDDFVDFNSFLHNSFKAWLTDKAESRLSEPPRYPRQGESKITFLDFENNVLGVWPLAEDILGELFENLQKVVSPPLYIFIGDTVKHVRRYSGTNKQQFSFYPDQEKYIRMIIGNTLYHADPDGRIYLLGALNFDCPIPNYISISAFERIKDKNRSVYKILSSLIHFHREALYGILEERKQEVEQ